MIALIAAAVLAAAPSAAKPHPKATTPLDIPAPRNLNRDEVLRWTGRHVPGKWTVIGYDYEGVKLIAPNSVKKTPEGHAEVDVRTELFEPIMLRAGFTARSGAAHWRVNCAVGRLYVTTMTIYAQNNLQGELATRTRQTPEWQDPVGSEADAIRHVCRAIGREPTFVPQEQSAPAA